MPENPIQPALRVLVVEDEMLIGLLLEDMITELGAIFVGPFATLASAREASLADDFDVALVDMHLGAERADELAIVLAQRRKPFALVSGGSDIADGLGQAAVLHKPFTFDDIARIVEQLDKARD